MMTSVSTRYNEVLSLVAERELVSHDLADERLFGIFPAPTIINNGSGPIETTIDRATVAQLGADYEADDLSHRSLAALYVQTGIIQAALRSHFDPRDSDTILEVYNGFSSPDNLSRQILDHESLTEEQERILLLGLREGTITADISGINATRLAVAVAYNNTVLPVDDLPDPDVFQSHMMSHLIDELDRKNVYTKLFTDFGGTFEHAVSQYSNTIPQLQIIGAFPMPLAEVDYVIDLIQPSR